MSSKSMPSTLPSRSLRPRWSEVIRRRFGDGETRDQIATAIGVSGEHVRHIELAAIRHLRPPELGDQVP